MFWAKYRGWFLLLVYIIFFGHTALWHHFGVEKVGHLGFGCIFGTMRDGVITAGTIFTIFIFIHALFFGGLFCGWMCHWGILQDLAAWIMKKCGIKPVFAQTNSRLIPWFWFLIMIGQVVLYWAYSGFPKSLTVNMAANPVWFMVPRSILMIVLTTIISGFVLIFLFGERAFCRAICVFRLWFNWFERLAPHKIRQTRECISCDGECPTVCPMGLAVVEEVKNLGHVKNPECIKCFRCVGACPGQVLESSMKKNEFHKEGPAIVKKSSLSSSIEYLQAAMAVIMVTVFGFDIGGNIALSLGFLIGLLIARILSDKSVSMFELFIIALLGVGIYFRIDMNDATSLVKGLIVLGAFLLAIRLLDYKQGLDFIAERAAKYQLPRAVTAVFLGLALFLGAREIHASMMVHKARAAMANKDYTGYINAMISCVDFFPDKAGAYYDLANAQLMVKDTDQAIENYKKSLEINFKQEAAEVILQRLMDANEEKAWVTMIDHLIKNYPAFPDFKLMKANYLITKQQLDEAEKLINEYIAAKPDSADGYITLGNLRMAQSKEIDAKELFDKAYKLSPGQGAVNLAAYHRWMEEYEKAETYFAEAIKYLPSDPTIRVERGVNFALQNKVDEAIACWQEALKIDPDFLPAKMNIERAMAIKKQNGSSSNLIGPYKINALKGN